MSDWADGKAKALRQAIWHVGDFYLPDSLLEQLTAALRTAEQRGAERMRAIVLDDAKPIVSAILAYARSGADCVLLRDGSRASIHEWMAATICALPPVEPEET